MMLILLFYNNGLHLSHFKSFCHKIKMEVSNIYFLTLNLILKKLVYPKHSIHITPTASHSGSKHHNQPNQPNVAV